MLYSSIIGSAVPSASYIPTGACISCRLRVLVIPVSIFIIVIFGWFISIRLRLLSFISSWLSNSILRFLSFIISWNIFIRVHTSPRRASNICCRCGICATSSCSDISRLMNSVWIWLFVGYSIARSNISCSNTCFRCFIFFTFFLNSSISIVLSGRLLLILVIDSGIISGLLDGLFVITAILNHIRLPWKVPFRIDIFCLIDILLNFWAISCKPFPFLFDIFIVAGDNLCRFLFYIARAICQVDKVLFVGDWFSALITNFCSRLTNS